MITFPTWSACFCCFVGLFFFHSKYWWLVSSLQPDCSHPTGAHSCEGVLLLPMSWVTLWGPLPGWYYLVWGPAPNLHCISVRNGCLSRSWNLLDPAPLHLIVLTLYINVHRLVQNKGNLKDEAWETGLKGGRLLQMRWGQCHTPSQSHTCVPCSLAFTVWYPLQWLEWQFIRAQLNGVD